MKIIITGGTGLIGSALANALASSNEVVVLTRDPSKPTPQLSSSVRRVKWDSKSAEGWVQEAEGADAIVHLAGESISPEAGLWTAERKRRIKQSRVESTQAVVEAIRQTTHKPKVLIQGSAVGYYGPCGDDLITESAPPGHDFLAEVAQAWEAASDPVEAMGVRRAIIRTGVVLSSKGGTLKFAALPFKLFIGGQLGNGKQYWPWIHIDDEIGAIRFLIQNDNAQGVFNLSAPNPVTNKEFAVTMGKVLGRPSLFPTPAFMLKLVLGEMSTIVLDGQRAVPRALQDAGYDFQFPNLEGALRDLL